MSADHTRSHERLSQHHTPHLAERRCERGSNECGSWESEGRRLPEESVWPLNRSGQWMFPLTPSPCHALTLPAGTANATIDLGSVGDP